MSGSDQASRAISSLKNRITALQEQRIPASRSVDVAEEAMKALMRTDDFGQPLPADIPTAIRRVKACVLAMKQLSDFFNDEPRFLIQIHNKLATASSLPEDKPAEVGEPEEPQSEGGTSAEKEEPTDDTDPAEQAANSKRTGRTGRKRQSGPRPLKRD